MCTNFIKMHSDRFAGPDWGQMDSKLKPSKQTLLKDVRENLIKVYWWPCSGTYQDHEISLCFPMARSSCCVLLVSVFVVSRQHRLPPSSSICYSAGSTKHVCGWFCRHNNMITFAPCTTQSKQSCFCIHKINMITVLQNQLHAYKQRIQTSQNLFVFFCMCQHLSVTKLVLIWK